MRTNQEHGFTLTELLIVVALMGVLAAIAIPMLLRARQSGYQSSAIGSLRTVISAQFLYGTSCGNGFFAPALTTLGRAPAGGPAFIGPDLGAADVVVKSAYTLTIGSSTGADPSSPSSCNGQAAGTSPVGYWATATPTLNAGSYAYGTNANGTIYQASQLAQLAMTDATAPAGAQVISK